MCKGTTNNEDVYVIDISNLPQIIPNNITNKFNGLPVDKCIGKEIEYLLQKGVITYGCCCGHGSDEPSCLVDKQSKDVISLLGYKLEQYSDLHTEKGIYEIKLKGE